MADFGPNQTLITDNQIIFGFPHQVYSTTADFPDVIFSESAKTLQGFSSVTGAKFIVPSVANPENYAYLLSIKAVLWYQALSATAAYYFLPGKLVQYGNIAAGLGINPVLINGAPMADTLTPEYSELALGQQINTIDIPEIAMRGGVDLANLQTTEVFRPDIAQDYAPYLGINVRVTLLKK